MWVINYSSIIVPSVGRRKRRDSFVENHWYDLLTKDWEDVIGRAECKKDQGYDKN